MELIWHGTAAIEVVCSSGRILFDPFIPLKGSGVDVKIEEFDGVSDVFVTHGHFDHISDLPEIVQRNPDVRIHCTKTPYAALIKKGVMERNLFLIGYGQTILCQGFTIHTFHGMHAILPKVSFSRLGYALRSPARGNLPHILRENSRCRENDETVFYQIEAEGKSVSLMGSLNLRDEVDYPTEADVLVLPYNGWEDNFPPAAEIIDRLKPQRVLLDHYDDTFPPLTMPLDMSQILKSHPGMVTPMELHKTERISLDI